MGKRLIVLIQAVLLAVFAHAAMAETYEDATPGQLIGVPVYDPDAKRYFALMHTEPGPPYVTMWPAVSQQAQRQTYKGVHGRLAIVDSAEIHSFLLRTFRPNHYQFVWIGLRYLCRAKKLEWSDGRMLQPGSFQAWDKEWNQDVYTCSDKNNPNDWAPVVYTPEMHSWIVKGNTKGYLYYFVEFPTGQP